MNNSHRAFSLLELLLALSIFVVVAVCVYGTFWTGARLSDRSKEEYQTYHQIRLALDTIGTDLENAVFYDFTNSYPGKTAFEGKEDAVTFLTISKDALRVIRYSLKSIERDHIHRVVIGRSSARNVTTIANYREQGMRLSRLVREEWNFIDYVSGAREIDSETIAVDIKENSLKFVFGYLPGEGKEKNKADDLYEWHPRWLRPYLPRMVRVQMDFFVAGREQRTISVHKDVFMPHGTWGKLENS